MSDPTPPQPEPQGPQALREAHERATARAAELETQQEQLARENAMLRARVDLDSPVGQLFARGYEGEASTDAVRAAWEALGVTTPAAPAGEAGGAPPAGQPADDGPTAEEQAAQQARQALTQGGSTPPGEEPSPEPWEAAYAEREAALKSGTPRDTADGRVLDRIFDAAGRGDERVLYDHERYHTPG